MDKSASPERPAAAARAGGESPVFTTRDPNTAAFWDERFRQGFVPWDQTGVPAAFAAFAARTTPRPVLIPGCGSAYEAGWLARAGWKLIYTDVPTEYFRGLEDQRKVSDFMFSLGLNVSMREYAQIVEVLWAGPAYSAGLTVGTVIIAVNGMEYRPERLRQAIINAHNSHTPIELIVKNLDRYRTVRIPYFDGLKYPRLERIEHAEDRLAAITKPRT